MVIEYLQTWSIDDDKGPFKDAPKFKKGAQRAAKERLCLPIKNQGALLLLILDVKEGQIILAPPEWCPYDC